MDGGEMESTWSLTPLQGRTARTPKLQTALCRLGTILPWVDPGGSLKRSFGAAADPTLYSLQGTHRTPHFMEDGQTEERACLRPPS